MSATAGNVNPDNRGSHLENLPNSSNHLVPVCVLWFDAKDQFKMSSKIVKWCNYREVFVVLALIAFAVIFGIVAGDLAPQSEEEYGQTHQTQDHCPGWGQKKGKITIHPNRILISNLQLIIEHICGISCVRSAVPQCSHTL